MVVLSHAWANGNLAVAQSSSNDGSQPSNSGNQGTASNSGTSGGSSSGGTAAGGSASGGIAAGSSAAIAAPVVAGAVIAGLSGVSLPPGRRRRGAESFDWRSHKKVTPVRDQVPVARHSATSCKIDHGCRAHATRAGHSPLRQRWRARTPSPAEHSWS